MRCTHMPYKLLGLMFLYQTSFAKRQAEDLWLIKVKTGEEEDSEM